VNSQVVLTRRAGKTRKAQIALYNDGGYLTRRIDRRGLVREFQYDTLGRNTAEIWYDTAADAEMDVNRQNTLNFTYDALGRMLSAGDQFASYAYAYDRLGRMTSSDAAIAGLAPTVTLTNAYDAAGHRTQVAAAIGDNADYLTDYAYDQLGRTTSIRQYAFHVDADLRDAMPPASEMPDHVSTLPVADKRVDFTYDLASQPVALTRFADLSGNQLVAATDFLFDQAGRLTGMTHGRQLPLPPGEGGGEGIFADYDWAFDEANRMTRFESLIDGVADYTNDDTGQLTGAEYTAGAGLPTAPPDEQYVYDENGNRVNNGYTVGPNNQLLSDGTHTYTYDEEGNRTSRTHIATGEVTEHHWDHRNRLVRVTTRATANGPLTTDIHYAYDFGQRWIRKTVDTNADGTIEESRIFVHDNGQIVLDFQKTGIGDAASGDLSHRYLWGHHVDQILADETVDTGSATDMAWTLTDHLNTVRDLVAYDPATDTTTVIKHITYGAFGNVTNDSAPGIDSLFLFTARPYDPDTGLQNNLNRWYDLSTGRWMSEDPAGYLGGDVNLVRYVQGAPHNGADPLGLWRQSRPGSSIWIAEDDDDLEGLSREVTKALPGAEETEQDWVCIWPLTYGRDACSGMPNRELWSDYPKAKRCARADVSNLVATSGPDISMRAQFRLDTDREARRRLAFLVQGYITNPNNVFRIRYAQDYFYLALTVSPIFRNAYVWTNGQHAAQYLATVSQLGKTPIHKLWVGGHSDGTQIRSYEDGTGFDVSHVLALARSLGVGDNANNKLAHAERKQGPPKCWFTRDSRVGGFGCATGQGEKSWAGAWANQLARLGSTVLGAPNWIAGVLLQLQVLEDGPNNYSFVGNSVFYHSTPQGERLEDATWVSFKGTQ
jgi:RHS repeat-associated protein